MEKESARRALKMATEDLKSKADILKDEGNALFAESQYKDAIAKYSEAIAIYDKSEIYWCNRAFANLKCENFGDAIADATKSIELNPKHVKAYFHRGTAHLILGQLDDAIKYFGTVRFNFLKNFFVLYLRSIVTNKT